MFFINLVLVDSKTIRQLNKKHRGLDKATSVLSFFYGLEKNLEGQANTPLGEIFICPGQAKEKKLNFKDLVNHGLDNLLSEISPATLKRIGFDRSWVSTSKSG